MDPITEDFIRRTWGEEQLAFWQQRPEIQLHQLFEQLNHQQRNGILPVEESIGPMVEYPGAQRMAHDEGGLMGSTR